MTNPSVDKKIPKSCQDLFELGQTINGIYMLHNSDEKKILSAFCDFGVPKYSPGNIFMNRLRYFTISITKSNYFN